MAGSRRKQLLIINMEYSQDEINEPINIDILIQCLPSELFDNTNTTIVYRDFGEITHMDLKCYDIVLISTKISSYSQLQTIIDACDHKIVIVGGILSICASEELAITFPNIIFNTGESETNLSDILCLAITCSETESLKQEIVRRNIPNMCFYYEPEKGVYYSQRSICNLAVCKTPEHNKIEDVINNNGLVRMETSRGCPWNNCTFCVMPWKFCGYGWRSFSKSKVEEEINYLIYKGATQILFTDEDFVSNREHIVELCDIIEKCTLDCNKPISFGGSTSVLTLFRLGQTLDECLMKMKHAGIGLLFMGIESGCNSQLKRYNKGVTVEMNEKMLTKLKAFGFQIDIGFIMFDADTTMDELRENLEFIQKNELRNTVSRFAKKLRVTPHTALYNSYFERGLIKSGLKIDELYYEYTFCDSTIELICKFLEELDGHILRESYQLQAIIRSRAAKMINQEKAQKRLLQLRECEYSFLYQCVNKYNMQGALVQEDIQKIYNDCLWQGGSV